MPSRIIKQSFFKNEYMADLAPLTRLLFIGLWTIADRDGKLEDRPRRIKAEALPYDECDVDQMLDELASGEDSFIIRYETNGKKCILIRKFTEHQSIHPNEKKSVLPDPSLKLQGITGNYREDVENTESVENENSHKSLQEANPASFREIPCNSGEVPEIIPSFTSTSTNTSSSIEIPVVNTNCARAREEQESCHSSEEKTEEEDLITKIQKRIDHLWVGYVVQVGTSQWDSIEEISQYPADIIDEAFDAAEAASLRKGNFSWILNRLRYPERYGLKPRVQQQVKMKKKNEEMAADLRNLEIKREKAQTMVIEIEHIPKGKGIPDTDDPEVYRAWMIESLDKEIEAKQNYLKDQGYDYIPF